jgi:hypothetical protein
MLGLELLRGLIIQEQDVVEKNVGGSVEEEKTNWTAYLPRDERNASSLKDTT